MSAQTTTATPAPQQINVADLELPQLAEVKRQLEEVCSLRSPRSGLHTDPNFDSLGAFTPDQLFCPTQAGTGKIQIMHREREGGQTREQKYTLLAIAFLLYIRLTKPSR